MYSKRPSKVDTLGFVRVIDRPNTIIGIECTTEKQTYMLRFKITGYATASFLKIKMHVMYIT